MKNKTNEKRSSPRIVIFLWSGVLERGCLRKREFAFFFRTNQVFKREATPHCYAPLSSFPNHGLRHIAFSKRALFIHTVCHPHTLPKVWPSQAFRIWHSFFLLWNTSSSLHLLPPLLPPPPGRNPVAGFSDRQVMPPPLVFCNCMFYLSSYLAYDLRTSYVLLSRLIRNIFLLCFI